MEDEKAAMARIENRIIELDRKIKVLSWDLDHNQINAARKKQLEDYKKEYDSLKQELEALQIPKK